MRAPIILRSPILLSGTVVLILVGLLVFTYVEQEFAMTGAGTPRYSKELVADLKASQVGSGVVTQLIDRREQVGTFSQRYLYSTEFARSAEAPVLFYLCGEWECGQRDVQNLSDTAQALGAAIVALEHRYYGSSRPFSDDTVANLRFLTIAHALDDAVDFQRQIAAKGILPRGPWIVVGGSYAGSLAAFYRAEHPDLVVGAWAESAGVNLKFSYRCADETAARDLGFGCSTLLREALNDAGARFDAGQADAVWAQVFGSGGAPADKALFLKDLFFIADFRNRSGLTELCSHLGGNPVGPLAGLAAYRSEKPKSMAPSQPAAVAASRDWNWQACTEYGGFWVHNAGEVLSVMPEIIDESFWRRRCMEEFDTPPRVEEITERYYPPMLDGSVTNILFTNGSADQATCNSFGNPRTTPDGLTSVLLDGTHWPSLHALRGDDPPDVWHVHSTFVTLARYWMSLPTSASEGGRGRQP